MVERGSEESRSLPNFSLFCEVLPCYLYNAMCVSNVECVQWPAWGGRKAPRQTQVLKGDATCRFGRSMRVFISFLHSSDKSLGGPLSPWLNLEGCTDLREDQKEGNFIKARCHTAISIS